MCGRYASSATPDEIVDHFEVVTRPDRDLAADFNVAPTDPVYAVTQREQRTLEVQRWGLVPSWAKDPKIGSRMINARLETVAEKPAFRKAFARRRAILPADGYYEWYQPSDPKARKQPYFIRPADGGLLAMAGLYELWRDPARSEDDPDRWLVSCAVITTAATDDVGRIHDRMPMMVPAEAYSEWLDPAHSEPDHLLSLLQPAAPGTLLAYPVSTAVGNVRNNGPELVEPIALDD